MSSIIQSFSKSLPTYLKDVEEPWGKLFYDLTWHHIDSHITNPTRTILDVGCGFGHSAIRMAEQGHVVTGMDITPDMIKMARQRSEGRGLNITFFEGKVEELHSSINKHTFDWVLCHNLLEYLSNPRETLQQLSEMLHPTGSLSLLVHNPTAKVLKKGIIEADFSQAQKNLHQMTFFNSLIGTELTQYPLDTLKKWLEENNLELESYYGVRSIFDYIVGEEYKTNKDWYENILSLEKEVTGISPYRDIAQFTHIIAKRVSK
jgi:S-adenosylmethionine-dependent methyltransferase